MYDGSAIILSYDDLKIKKNENGNKNSSSLVRTCFFGFPENPEFRLGKIFLSGYEVFFVWLVEG